LLAGLPSLIPAHGFWHGVLIAVVALAGLVFVASFFFHVEGGSVVRGGEGKKTEQKVDQKNEGGGDNISNQQGDNSIAFIKSTLQIVAPQPNLRTQIDYENRPAGDYFTSRLHVWVQDAYAANGLRVEVTGQTITDHPRVMPTGNALPTFRDVELLAQPDHAIFQFRDQVAPEYIVEVTTQAQDALTVSVVLL